MPCNVMKRCVGEAVQLLKAVRQQVL